ncbi:CD36 family-domain-containing protein [Pelagophyceae sp. CCMP2097]|nr:CD36 family-domain-containing protein [Pelagophyceae sp. CCMP2097]
MAPMRAYAAWAWARRALLLGILGAIAIPGGVVLFFKIEALIQLRIYNTVTIGTRSQWRDQYTGVSRNYDAHIWHCSNALAVQETGAKPHLEDVVVKLQFNEENFDFSFYDKKKQYRYKSWWHFYGKDEHNEGLLDSEFVVSLNPVYLGAIAAYGGSETRMFAGLSYAVVGNVAAIVDGVVARVRVTSVPAYLNGVAAQLMAAAPDAFPNVGRVAVQWGRFGVTGSAVSGMNPALKTFEAASATFSLLDAQAVDLWDPAFEFSLVSAASYGKHWLPALVSAPGARAALGLALGAVEAGNVLAWLGALVDEANPYYYGAVKRGLNLSPADAADATGWRALSALQFGRGALTRGVAASDSVLPLRANAGIVVAPELFAYSNALGEPVSLDVAAATAFLKTFSNAALSRKLVASLRAGDFSVFADPTYRATGLTPANAHIYTGYLYTYLAESLFLKGFVVGFDRDWNTARSDPLGVQPGSLSLKSDGTGRVNSGLFTRRSLRDMLFGYEDPIFGLVPVAPGAKPNRYDGLLGFQYDSVADQRADVNSPLTYAQFTGKGNPRDIGRYALWRNVTEMVIRPDIPSKGGLSYDCSTWQSQGFDMYPDGFESCNIWGEGHAPKPFGAHVTQVPPGGRRDFFFKKAVPEKYAIWVTTVLRPLNFEYDSDAVVRGVSVRRYLPEYSQFHTADCEREPERCNVANVAFRMDKTPGFIIPLHTTVGGPPSVVALPALGQMEPQYIALFTGLPAYNKHDHGSYVDVEPETGYIVQAHKRLQYAWSVSDKSLNSPVWANLYANTDDGQLFWPWIWIDDNSKLGKMSARTLKRGIYDSRIAAAFFSALISFSGLVFVAAALYLRAHAPADGAAVVDEKKADAAFVTPVSPVSVSEVDLTQIGINEETKV